MECCQNLRKHRLNQRDYKTFIKWSEQVFLAFASLMSYNSNKKLYLTTRKTEINPKPAGRKS